MKGNKKDLENTNFPFDIRHIEILTYTRGTSGEDYLKDQLKIRIENILENSLKNVQSEIKEIYIRMEDNEFKQSIISNFEIRKSRISYFTNHIIRNLIRFRNEHVELKKLLKDCQHEPNEKNFKKFNSRAHNMRKSILDYHIPFTQHLLNNSSNFIANPWIVNKFLDYFESFRTSLVMVENLSIVAFDDFHIISSTIEDIEHNISDLTFCINALNEERKLVYLDVIDKE